MRHLQGMGLQRKTPTRGTMSYENMHKLVKYFREIQVKDDNDVFVGVTGRKGCGKSTLSIQLSRAYVKQYFNEDYFSIRKYVAYNNKDVFDKMYTLPKFSPIPGDEAIRFAWSRDWNKSDNKDLTRLSTQIRPKKHILFMNIPKLSWIDKAYREGMIDIWIWIHSVVEEGEKKSYAMVFEPDDNQGYTDSWHLKELKKAKGRIKRIGRFTDIDKLYNIVKRHPCFLDVFSYPKLPDEIYEDYLKIRQQKVMEGGAEFVDSKEIGKIICYNLFKNWDIFSGKINETRFKKATYRTIADLSYDPARKRPLVQYTTIKNWIDEVSKTINADNKIAAQDQEGTGKADGIGA